MLRATFRSVPSQRGEQQQRAAALLEALFDLGEVVEVIEHGVSNYSGMTGIRKAGVRTV